MVVAIVLILTMTRIISANHEANHEGFIVGGEIVNTMQEFAYCAFLDIDDEFICGSSIVNQNILLTAAHCVKSTSVIIANVGNADREAGQNVRVAAYLVHNKFSEVTITNDIAVCKLNKQLVFGPNVKRVALVNQAVLDKEGEVAGWGAVEETNYEDSRVLQHTRQKLWSFKNCKTVMKEFLPLGTICGGESNSKSHLASKGDSGSALVVRKLIQVGLVSFKNPNISKSLVVYTDVAQFYSWIKTAVQSLMCSN